MEHLNWELRIVLLSNFSSVVIAGASIPFTPLVSSTCGLCFPGWPAIVEAFVFGSVPLARKRSTSGHSFPEVARIEFEWRNFRGEYCCSGRLTSSYDCGDRCSNCSSNDFTRAGCGYRSRHCVCFIGECCDERLPGQRPVWWEPRLL